MDSRFDPLAAPTGAARGLFSAGTPPSRLRLTARGRGGRLVMGTSKLPSVGSPSTALVAGALVLAVSCSEGGEPSLGEQVAGTDVESVDALDSSATVVVGELSFTVPVDCYGAGAGDIVVVGEGETSDGERVAVRIESSVVESYVGVQVGATTPVIYEPALDKPLDLFLVDDGIEGGAIFFVRDLDVVTGVGTDAGVGSVDVTCVEYLRDLPSGP